MVRNRVAYKIGAQEFILLSRQLFYYIYLPNKRSPVTRPWLYAVNYWMFQRKIFMRMNRILSSRFACYFEWQFVYSRLFKGPLFIETLCRCLFNDEEERLDDIKRYFSWEWMSTYEYQLPAPGSIFWYYILDTWIDPLWTNEVFTRPSVVFKSAFRRYLILIPEYVLETVTKRPFENCWALSQSNGWHNPAM